MPTVGCLEREDPASPKEDKKQIRRDRETRPRRVSAKREIRPVEPEKSGSATTRLALLGSGSRRNERRHHDRGPQQHGEAPAGKELEVE